jgi:hypothetical protein
VCATALKFATCAISCSTIACPSLSKVGNHDLRACLDSFASFEGKYSLAFERSSSACRSIWMHAQVHPAAPSHAPIKSKLPQIQQFTFVKNCTIAFPTMISTTHAKYVDVKLAVDSSKEPQFCTDLLGVESKAQTRSARTLNF